MSKNRGYVFITTQIHIYHYVVYFAKMKGGYVVFGSTLLTISAVVIASLGSQALQLNLPFGQFGRMLTQNAGAQALLLIGQKIMPIFVVGGAVCLGHGICAKR